MYAKPMMKFSFFSLVVGVMIQCNSAVSQEIDTDIHEFFAASVGEWDVTYKNWSISGTTKPEVMEGDETCDLFGRHWLTSDLTMENGIKSKWTLGYLAKNKTLSGCSIINFSPYMQQQNGTYNHKTKTLTLSVKDKDVITGEATEGKIEFTIVNKDKRICLYFGKDLATGKFNKTGEVTYVRKAAKGNEDNEDKKK